MCAATLLLLAALPTLAGRTGWCAGGEVSVVGGRGPAFAPRQRTALVAPAGHAATLDCQVLRLGDKSVSWVRSRDLQILSHAGAVFTADARVSASGAGARHSLHIERLRLADAGRYECQVNTEPKLSLFFNLTVVDEAVPTVVVSALDSRSVSGPAGGSATLACSARYEPPPKDLPMPPLDIRWQRGDQLINVQSGRGGVSLDTERWPARAVSRLTLAELSAADEGPYSCSAADTTATLYLRLVDEEPVEAMQRDQATARAAGAALARVAALASVLLQLLARWLR